MLSKQQVAQQQMIGSIGMLALLGKKWLSLHLAMRKGNSPSRAALILSVKSFSTGDVQDAHVGGKVRRNFLCGFCGFVQILH